MSAPERIWVDFFDTDFEGITCMDVAPVPFLSAIEYVRADIAAAQVAAARAEALREALGVLRKVTREPYLPCSLGWSLIMDGEEGDAIFTEAQRRILALIPEEPK